VLTARRTIGLGSQSGLTKHRVDRVGRVDLSNTYRVIVGLLVMVLGLGLSLCGSTVGHPPATAGLLVYDVVRFQIEVQNITLNTHELPAVADQWQPVAVAIFNDDIHLHAQRRQHARTV